MCGEELEAQRGAVLCEDNRGAGRAVRSDFRGWSLCHTSCLPRAEQRDPARSFGLPVCIRGATQCLHCLSSVDGWVSLTKHSRERLHDG